MSEPYVYHRAEDLGIPVVDAKARAFVAVTQSDVVNAKKANSKHCALSRGALRLPGVVAAYFFRATAFIEYKDRILRYRLPQSVQKEIVSFDRAQIFDPGVYQLSEIPPMHARTPENAKRNRKRAKEARAGKIGRIKRSRIENESLRAAVEKIAASDPRNDTAEQRDFDRRVAALSRRTVGATNGKAPIPLHSMGPGAVTRRTQYIRDIKDLGDE